MTEGRGPGAEFLAKAFKSYYFRHVEEVDIPDSIEAREFGYLNFEGAMVRHLTFPNAGELKAALVRESPRSAYSSVAYYDSPQLPMEDKGYRKADLAFDIDTGELNLPCTAEHDFSMCENCGKPSRTAGDACPSCGSTSISSIHWACEKCLGAAKEEAIKLLDFLQRDFGVAPNEISAYFSGNRGYHVHVIGSKYDLLDQRGRSEIVEYLEGKGFTARQMGLLARRTAEELSGKVATPDEPGWRGRVASALMEDGLGAREALAQAFMAEPDRVGSLVEKAIGKVGVRVDAGVTIDTHRVFRLGGTLHDKSGMQKKKYRSLEGADPMVDAVAFGGETVRMSVGYSPRFWMRGTTFGPYEKTVQELPMYAAVYLAAKGLAVPTAAGK